jgi:hypothetical protein
VIAGSEGSIERTVPRLRQFDLVQTAPNLAWSCLFGFCGQEIACIHRIVESCHLCCATRISPKYYRWSPLQEVACLQWDHFEFEPL